MEATRFSTKYNVLSQEMVVIGPMLVEPFKAKARHLQFLPTVRDNFGTVESFLASDQS